MLTHNDKVRLARTAGGEELWDLVRDPSQDVIMNAVLNMNFNEDMAVFIARKKNTAPEILSMLATDIRFRGCYKLKLAICNNPKTPLKVTLSLLKFLRIFDMC